MVVTVAGGVIGAILLLCTSSKAFTYLLPWLLLLASLALAFARQLGERLRQHCKIRPRVVMTVQFALGIYGGYFGGAVGIMMLAVWSLLDGGDLKRLNGPRTMLVSAANVIAVLIFISAGVVHWPETAVMLLAAMVGGYAGAHIGRRAPPRLIRAATLLLTVCITLAFFVRA
jgi:uncharacterized membrane protein YfcA